MSWLCDSNGAPVNPYLRPRPRFTEEERLAIELVVGYVHPGHLGALPPSPSTLLYKARQLGLIAA